MRKPKTVDGMALHGTPASVVREMYDALHFAVATHYHVAREGCLICDVGFKALQGVKYWWGARK